MKQIVNSHYLIYFILFFLKQIVYLLYNKHFFYNVVSIKFYQYKLSYIYIIILIYIILLYLNFSIFYPFLFLKSILVFFEIYIF